VANVATEFKNSEPFSPIALTSGSNNIAIGSASLQNGTTAADNVLIGYRAGQALTTGRQNIIVGVEGDGNWTGKNLTTGVNNVYIGQGVANASSDNASYNILLGYHTGLLGSQGSYNIGLGAAVFREGVGEKNVALGDGPMYSANGADRNIAFGNYTMFSVSGDQNIFIGDRLQDNSTSQWTGSRYFALGSQTTAQNALLYGYHGTEIPKFLNINGNLEVSGSSTLKNTVVTGSLNVTGSNNTVGRLIVSQSVNDQTDGAFVLHSVRNSEDLIRMYEYGGQAVIKAPRGNGLFFIEGGLGGNDFVKLNESITVYPSAGAYNRENGVDISANTKITGSLVVTGSITSTTTASFGSLAGAVTSSLVRNTADTYTSSAAVQQIVTLTQTEYNAIGSPDANTLYIISGSTALNTASFATTGSNTFVGNLTIYYN